MSRAAREKDVSAFSRKPKTRKRYEHSLTKPTHAEPKLEAEKPAPEDSKQPEVNPLNQRMSKIKASMSVKPSKIKEIDIYLDLTPKKTRNKEEDFQKKIGALALQPNKTAGD